MMQTIYVAMPCQTQDWLAAHLPGGLILSPPNVAPPGGYEWNGVWRLTHFNAGVLIWERYATEQPK